MIMRFGIRPAVVIAMKRMKVVVALIGGVHTDTKAQQEEKVRVGRGLPEKRCGRKAPNNVLFPTPSTNAVLE